MAKQAKFYPVLPYAKKSDSDYLHGGKRAAKSKTSFGDNTLWNVTYANGVIFQAESTQRTSTQIGLDSASYVNNPGWRVAIAKGGEVTSNYSREVYLLGSSRYSCTSVSKAGKPYVSHCSGTIYGGLYTSAKSTTAIDSIAAGRLRHKLDGYVGNAQLAAPLAESREIHRLVKQINALGMDTLRAVLALKKSKGKSAAKQFGQIWLGFGFGVNPLLHDLQSAADSILKYTTRQDQRVVVSGTASEDWTTVIPKSGYGVVCYGTNLGMHHYSVHRQSVRYVAGIDLQTRSAANYGVTDHLGLKISDVPGTLWELTPFSWVADYFATVQPWVEDMFYTLPGVCKYACQSTKYQCVTTSIPYFETIGAFSMNARGSGSPAVSRQVTFNRVRLSGLPVRQLRIKSVDEVANHGLTKLLNLASVIAGKHGPNLSEGPIRETPRRTRPAPDRQPPRRKRYIFEL